jgi:hypothetical protein
MMIRHVHLMKLPKEVLADRKPTAVILLEQGAIRASCISLLAS